MKKCRKNLLLILEFVAALFAILAIIPFSYFKGLFQEGLMNKIYAVEDLCRYMITAFIVILVSLIALFERRSAYNRNGDVAFPFQKAVIFPLVSYVLGVSAYLLHQEYTSVIFNDFAGKFTAYCLFGAIVLVLVFYILLARVIYKKGKVKLPTFFNLVLLVMMLGVVVVALENKNYFVELTEPTAYYLVALGVIGGLIILNYVILVIEMNKLYKSEIQEKGVREVLEDTKEEPVEEQVEETPAEEVVEEPKAEEAPTEEQVEEAPAEEVVEEPKAEEAPAEEVVEEPKAEEAPAEEVAEEPKVEEAPAEEVVEEPKAEEEPAEEVVEEPKVEEALVATPKEPKPVKVIKPTPQALMKFVQSNFDDIVIVVDPDGVSFKASRKKKMFINLKSNANDYRITFQRKPIGITRLIVKYPSITKAKSPVGDQWFKLVNKGEFSESDLHNIIKGSYNFLVEEEAKAALKKQKEKEKAALKKQKEKEKAAEKRKKEREKAKLAAAKEKAKENK